MGKEVKTNAMRILDRHKVAYEILNYECDEFIDGLHTAELTGAPVEQTYKTLVMQGKSKAYYVFVVQIAEEVDLKAAARAALAAPITRASAALSMKNITKSWCAKGWFTPAFAAAASCTPPMPPTAPMGRWYTPGPAGT